MFSDKLLKIKCIAHLNLIKHLILNSHPVQQCTSPTFLPVLFLMRTGSYLG